MAYIGSSTRLPLGGYAMLDNGRSFQPVLSASAMQKKLDSISVELKEPPAGLNRVPTSKEACHHNYPFL